MNYNPLKNIVKLQKEGNAVGIYSCCSANEYVVRAVLENGLKDDSVVLIESTANQVDHNGGYTGMTPSDFFEFVHKLAKEIGLDSSKIFLGGDHLGPLTYIHLDEEEAMKEAERVIEAYVAAGFTKIHIDTSMKVASDDPNIRLSDEIISARGARLAKVANNAYLELLKTNPEATKPVYIIGSEVPIPGGAKGEEVATELEVTKVEDFEATYNAFHAAFDKEGLSDIWEDVIGIVVQPGIEEKDDGCVEYDREKAKELMASIKNYPHLVFEGHSSDYQTKFKLRELVEDGVGILKVGPGLTYAMREGVFALAYIEKELYHDQPEQQSNFIEVLDAAMLENPGKWEPYYHGTPNEIRIKRKFSFSDRQRYYLPTQAVQDALNKLIANLSKEPINLSLLSQFMPIQYTMVREGRLENKPEELIKSWVTITIQEYMYASHQNEL